MTKIKLKEDRLVELLNKAKNPNAMYHQTTTAVITEIYETLALLIETKGVCKKCSQN